jgi:hypothetical protein
MAAFISGVWQGDSTRIPGRGKKLNEEQAGRAVSSILPHLSADTFVQVTNVMAGKTDHLSASAKAEFTGMLDGYINQQRSNF